MEARQPKIQPEGEVVKFPRPLSFTGAFDLEHLPWLNEQTLDPEIAYQRKQVERAIVIGGEYLRYEQERLAALEAEAVERKKH